MFEKADIRNNNTKIDTDNLSKYEEAMAKSYMEMGEINLNIANEMYHLETEATYTLENFLGSDTDD